MLRELLPQLLMPVPLTLGLLMLALARRNWRFGVAAGIILWVTATPLCANFLVRWVEGWRMRLAIASVDPCDAVLVLSGGLRLAPGDPIPEFDDFDRFLAGHDLLRAGKAGKLMFTGGWSPLQPDLESVGSVLRERAMALGVPEADAIVVGRASNTQQEAEAVRAYFQSHPTLEPTTGQPRAPRLILVTSAYHMTRAEALFRDAGLEVIPFPVDFRGPNPVTVASFLPCGSALAGTDMALHEIYGRCFDAIRGMASMPPASDAVPAR